MVHGSRNPVYRLYGILGHRIPDASMIQLINGEVWAVHTNARIKKILTSSGMTKIMQIYEEEQENGEHK